MIELIPDGAPQFVILVLCVGFMGLTLAVIAFCHQAGLLRQSILPWGLFPCINVFNISCLVFLCSLFAEAMGQLDILSRSHAFDLSIMLILLTAKTWLFAVLLIFWHGFAMYHHQPTVPRAVE